MLSTWGRPTRREQWILRGSPFARAWLTAMCVAAVCTVLTPALVLGDQQTYGITAFPRGVAAGAVVGLAMGPGAVLMTTGAEFDTGLREQRLVLGGGTFLRLSRAQLLATLVATIGAALITGALAAIGGLADQGFRAAIGMSLPVRAADAGSWRLASDALLTALALTTATWLVVHALRSGARAATALVLLLACWPILLSARFTGVGGVLISAHPLALPWAHLVGRFPIDVDTALAVPALAAWLAVTVLAACQGIRSPGRRPTRTQGSRCGWRGW